MATSQYVDDEWESSPSTLKPHTSTADNLSRDVSNINLQSNGDSTENEESSVTAADISLMKKILRTRLIQSRNDVEVTRSDPKSPLYSVKTFEELRLPEELLKGLYEMGFQAPSKIQETALPVLLANPPSNLIAQSQSGTGKTAAFVLASICRVDTNLNYPQALILSPTYELAMQTGEVAQQMAKYLPSLKFMFAVRGIDNPGTIDKHIIFGTPGKVMDWALRYRCFDIKKIKVFVLDEADVMIDTQGHRNQSIRIHKALPNDCQMMLFSATYDQPVMDFAEMIVSNPVIIRLKREEESLENINQYYVECANDSEKYRALANIFGTISMGQAFIFCHTKKSASWLAEKLNKDGHAVGLISGDLTVEQRTEVLRRFRDGQERVLISTNLMARGIDVDQVTVVINYDLPINVVTRDIDCETYLHRIGRTGRFGKLGLAINLVDGPKTMAMIRKLESHFGRKIYRLDATDVDEIEKISKD
ncbi:DEAD-box helicase Dbp80-like isoform X1 [Dinothrombium tinctorium]|uniref:RNA helicase n=1 Tax=Dinothrombium tinctorium TaxID=1965070 RepID=A0A443QZY7_9ACAR|nr:DEAD-box helicase Dbp80-like isoform X1 [Dinothrombium tinctorium]